MYGKLGPALHATLRVGAGLLFLQHGLQKLFGLLGGFGYVPKLIEDIRTTGATAPMMSRYGAAGVLEFVGGILLIVGFGTRPVALLLALEMLVAFSITHLPRGGAPIQNGGELALLYALIFAFLASHGAGPYSVDANLRRT